MDLEPIEERANEFATWVGKFDSEHRIPAAFASAADVPALLAEVERLRAEVRLAKASAHSASLALGSHLAARRDPEPMPVTMIAALTRAVAKTEARLATPKEPSDA